MAVGLSVINCTHLQSKPEVQTISVEESAHCEGLTQPKASKRPDISTFVKDVMTNPKPVKFNFELKELDEIAHDEPWKNYFNPPYFFKNKTTWDKYGDNIKTQELIGRGRFSDVFRATDKKKNLTIALKVLRKKKIIENMGIHLPVSMANREIYILAKLPKHRNVCQFDRALETKANIFLLMEYCGRETLFAKVQKWKIAKKTLKAEKLKGYFRQMVEGAIALHKANIFQVDLKLTNMVLSDDGLVKYIDFGLAHLSDSRRHQVTGANGYPSINMLSSSGFIPSKEDIWKLGVCLYMLHFHVYPFGLKQEEVIRRERSLDYKMPEKADPLLKDILAKIFVDEKDRITLQGLLDHPWLSSLKKENPDLESPKKQL